MRAASITRLCVLTVVLVTAPTIHAAVPLPNGSTVQEVDFERHVMGLFGRTGCALGSCHGSFQGKGGFRLSLFGYDPEKDYIAVTREVSGRRIDRVEPDKSLLLLKATGQIEHGGGRRFGIDSWQYRVLRDWIANGTPWTKGSGEVASIRLMPAEYAFKKARESGQLKVLARFTNGSEEDITPFCDFRVNDDAVAEVGTLGQVKALRPGDTAVVVSYRGNVLPVRVLVPYEGGPGFIYPKLPEVNYVDREVFTKLRRLNIVPSELAGDAEFLRRVTIDTIGSLPTPDDVRAFLADKDPNKRTKKIDQLLAHPLHAAVWATKFSDITGNNTDALENPQPLKPKRSQLWHDWFRKRVADNVPYDQIVNGVLTATSRDGKAPEEWIAHVRNVDQAIEKSFDTSAYVQRTSLDLFWRRQQANIPPEQWGEKTAAAFMGVRLECAQCHKHPFDRWTQVDYRAHANLFAQISVGQSPEAAKAIAAENAERNKTEVRNNNQRNLVREMFVAATPRGALSHPDTGRVLTPKALGGPEFKIESGKDVRAELFQWLRSPDNPYFARSFVNRVWGHYFGIGIVEPVDDFSLANPPSNDKLLDALAKDFIEHNFDIRHIERTVLLSRTYQLASRTNETNRFDRTNYSHAAIRPMLAEVVVDVLNDAMGTKENFGNDVPPNTRATEIGVSRLANASLNYAFRIFGRSPRTLACDCERSMEPALPQKLFLMTDSNVLAKFQAGDGRLRKLVDSKMSDDEVLEELFLATVGRHPTEEDKRVFNSYKVNGRSRLSLFTDTLWALINTREFILNH